MDIILFAIVAIFLVWKLRSALNKEQSFLKNNNTNSQSTQTSKTIFLQNVKVLNVSKTSHNKKSQPSEVDALFETEKLHLDESLHEPYKAMLNLYPNLRVSLIKDISATIYEELLRALEIKNPTFFSFLPEKELYLNLKKKIEEFDYNIHLSKIESITIKKIDCLSKVVNIVVEIISKQLVYKENEEGNVIEGSKSIPVNVLETLEISYSTSGGNVWTLKSIV
jgi:hypothetical protein